MCNRRNACGGLSGETPHPAWVENVVLLRPRMESRVNNNRLTGGSRLYLPLAANVASLHTLTPIIDKSSDALSSVGVCLTGSAVRTQGRLSNDSQRQTRF